MAKMKILFDGFSDLAEHIDKASDNLQKAVNEALEATFKIIQTEVENATAIYSAKGGGKKGYSTSRMYQTIIKDGGVKWNGTVAEVSVGFDLSKKYGYHSIFVMYGTPRYPKDSKLYASIKGSRVKEEVAKAQEEILRSYLTI